MPKEDQEICATYEQKETYRFIAAHKYRYKKVVEDMKRYKTWLSNTYPIKLNPTLVKLIVFCITSNLNSLWCAGETPTLGRSSTLIW